MEFPRKTIAAYLNPLLWLLALALLAIAGLRVYSASGAKVDPDAILHRRISVDLNAQAPKALEVIGKAAGVKVVIARQIFDKPDPAATPDHTRIDLHLHNVELGVVLSQLERQLDLKILIEPVGDELHVTRRDLAPSTVRIYDVSDLVSGLMPNVTPAPVLGLNATSNNAPQNPLPTSAPAPLTPKQEAAEQLVRLITDSIEPDVWMSSGGTEATIANGGTCLIISAKSPTHRQIRKLLAELRAAGIAQPRSNP